MVIRSGVRLPNGGRDGLVDVGRPSRRSACVSSALTRSRVRIGLVFLVLDLPLLGRDPRSRRQSGDCASSRSLCGKLPVDKVGARRRSCSSGDRIPDARLPPLLDDLALCHLPSRFEAAHAEERPHRYGGVRPPLDRRRVRDRHGRRLLVGEGLALDRGVVVSVRGSRAGRRCDVVILCTDRGLGWKLISDSLKNVF